MPVTPITPAQIDEVGKGASASPSGHSRAEPSGLGPTAECPSRGSVDATALAQELEGLSEAATPGLCTIWQNSPLMLRDDTTNAWALTGTYTRAPEQAKANAEFLKALWNAYRSGQLVPAFAAANPSGKPTWIERAAWCAGQILPLIPEEWGEQRDTIEKAVPGTSIPHLRWMARQLAECQVDSETKACRWLGWLQHGIVSCCLSTLEDEKARNLASATKARQGRDDEGGSVEDAGAAPAGETPEVTPSIPPSSRKGQEENPCPLDPSPQREGGGE